MAFDANRVSTVSVLNPTADHATAPSPEFRFYVSPDSLATIKAANYFNTIAKKLQVGDFFICACADGMHWLKVTTITVAGVVTVAFAGDSPKMVKGQSTTVAASDTIATGLATVTHVVASFNDAPIEAAKFVSADIGDQVAAPVAGSFLLKTWKDTDADAAIAAATTFGLKVNWIAFGT